MSNNTKIVAWVVVAVVVVGGAWWWFSMSQTAVSPTVGVANPGQTPSNPAAVANPTPGTPANNGISMTDNSNAALQTDFLANVDSQMSGFSSDNASVNQGLGDQPVAQTPSSQL